MTGIKRPLVQDLPYSSTPCSIADPIEAGGLHLRATTSPTWSSQQDNYDAGYAHIIRANVTSACDLTGIDSLVSAGRRLVIMNVGSANLTLKDESASSSAANRMDISADITLSAGSSIELWYDEASSRWRHLSSPPGASGPSTHQMTVTMSGGGSAIPAGLKIRGRAPVSGTMTKVTLVGSPSGSLVLDVWKDTYANFPPTVADTITASAKPTLSSAEKYEDSTLTGWTVSFNAGDHFIINVDSCSGVTDAVLYIDYTRS